MAFRVSRMGCHLLLRFLSRKRVFEGMSSMRCSSSSLETTNIERKNLEVTSQTTCLPSLPSNDLCCQTGCSNCVYLVFADELLDYCKKEGKDPTSELNSLTQDPSVKAMILMIIKEPRVDEDSTKDHNNSRQ